MVGVSFEKENQELQQGQKLAMSLEGDKEHAEEKEAAGAPDEAVVFSVQDDIAGEELEAAADEDEAEECEATDDDVQDDEDVCDEDETQEASDADELNDEAQDEQEDSQKENSEE